MSSFCTIDVRQRPDRDLLVFYHVTNAMLILPIFSVVGKSEESMIQTERVFICKLVWFGSRDTQELRFAKIECH